MNPTIRLETATARSDGLASTHHQQSLITPTSMMEGANGPLLSGVGEVGVTISGVRPVFNVLCRIVTSAS